MRKKIFLAWILLLPCYCFAEIDTSYPIKGTLLPYATTKIGTQVAGRVYEILADVGQCVNQGEILLKIDPLQHDLEYQKKLNQVRLAELVYDKAVREFRKRQHLWDSKPPSISKQELEEAEFTMKQLLLFLDQARLDLETARIVCDETCIKMPYTGVITKRCVDAGDSVMPYGATLFEIMDLSQLWLEFALPQDLQSKVQIGDSIKINSFVAGKIEKILPNVDVTNRCFQCRVLLNNKEGLLKPGMFLTGSIILKTAE